MNWLKRIMILREQDGAPGAAPSLGERIRAMAGDEPNSMFAVSNDNQDASADKDDAEDTDLQGNQGDPNDIDGPDTTSEEDDQDTGLDEDEDEKDADESTDQEADETAEGNKPKRLTKDERMAELVDKRVNEILAQRDTQRASEAPDFAPPETVKAVKRNIVKWQSEIDELKGEIDLDGEDIDDDKIDKLLKLQDTVADAREALKKNEAAEAAWKKRQQDKGHDFENGTAARKRLDDTAELYRKEIKVDEPTWKRMGEWFKDQLAVKPLLVQEFNDHYARGGDVAAIRFAHEYTVKNMGKGTKEKNEQREKSKTTAAAATSAGTGRAIPLDLNKAYKSFNDDPSEENFNRLQYAKRKAAA